MKKAFVSLVAVAALAAPAGWASVAGAKTDPDANGDVHSNCHTGSKFRGAGGEDRPGIPNHAGDVCQAAPTPTPAPTPVRPVTPSAAAAQAQARAAAVSAAAPAAPVVAAPRTTG